MNEDQSLYYLAGIIDGEGSISIDRKSCSYMAVNGTKRTYYYHRVDLCISNTNPKLTSWLKENFGGTVSSIKRKSRNHSTVYCWRIYCRQAERLLIKAAPLLLLKRQQAELALSLFSKRTWGTVPESVFNERERVRYEISSLNRRFRIVSHIVLRPAVQWKNRDRLCG